jgi:hypothetical protein
MRSLDRLAGRQEDLAPLLDRPGVDQFTVTLPVWFAAANARVKQTPPSP